MTRRLVPRLRRAQAAEPRGEPSEKRRMLLEATFNEVAELGFSAVTLEDIAARAGVSKGVTLYYFESKEALFRELFQSVIDDLQERMLAATREGDAEARLNALVGVIFNSPDRTRAFYAVYTDFCSLSLRHESFRRVNERFYEGCRRLEREIIELGIHEGLFPGQDLDRAALVLRALIDGLMLRWLTEPHASVVFDRYREICLEELFLRLGARSGTARRNADASSTERPRLPKPPRKR